MMFCSVHDVDNDPSFFECFINLFAEFDCGGVVLFVLLQLLRFAGM